VQVPFLKIILRKAYGLGAIAMSGGADDAALFTVAWPTGEFGPMALEGRPSSVIETNWRRLRTRPSVSKNLIRWSRGCISAARRSTSPLTSRSTT